MYIYIQKGKVECSTCSFGPVACARKSLPNGLTGPQGTQLPLTVLSVFRDDKPPRPPTALPSLQSSLSSQNTENRNGSAKLSICTSLSLWKGVSFMSLGISLERLWWNRGLFYGGVSEWADFGHRGPSVCLWSGIWNRSQKQEKFTQKWKGCLALALI